MVQIGRTNRLQIVRWTPQGPYLGAEHGDILLPEKYAPEDADVGDWVEVFIYLDSEERLIATTQKPLAEVDQFAALRVIKSMEIGAFLDWGLDKDLLVPLPEQGKALEEGDMAVVRICLEEGRNRLYATNKLNSYLSFEDVPYRRGQQVQVLISNHTNLGAYTVVDQQFSGFIYRSSEDQDLPEIGSAVEAYVVKVRDDGKIDLTLKPMGITGLLEARKKILAAMEAADGRLNINDDSSPETIKARLGISKKSFKRALGILKREDMIIMGEKEITLNPDPRPRSRRRDDADYDEDQERRSFRTNGGRSVGERGKGRPVGNGPRRSDSRHRDDDSRRSNSRYRDGDSRRSESRHRDGDSRRSESRHRDGDSRRSDSRYRDGDSRRSESRHRDGDSQRSDSRYRDGDSRRSDSRHRDGDSRRSDSRYRDGDSRRSDSRHRDGDSRRSDSRYRDGDSRRSDSRHRDGDSRRSDSRYRDGDSRHSDSRHRDGDSRRSDSRYRDGDSRRSDSRHRDGDSRRSDSRYRDGDSRRSDSRHRDGDSRRSDSRHRDGDSRRSDSRYRDGDSRRSDSRHRDGDSRRSDSRHRDGRDGHHRGDRDRNDTSRERRGRFQQEDNPKPRGNKSRDHRKGNEKKVVQAPAAPIFKKVVDEKHPFARFANTSGGQGTPKKKSPSKAKSTTKNKKKS